jgi:hypothetical protein
MLLDQCMRFVEIEHVKAAKERMCSLWRCCGAVDRTSFAASAVAVKARGDGDPDVTVKRATSGRLSQNGLLGSPTVAGHKKVSATASTARK